ncbi:MAG: hypothetical protein L0G23_06930 [Ruaniaceae bacterium]|nr:hypothetical protein [Ruaniaceae bacterium]
MNALQRYLVRFRLWISEPEKGDVPGWVLVVLMTAGLVITIWLLAEGALQRVFTTAIDRILGV